METYVTLDFFGLKICRRWGSHQELPVLGKLDFFLIEEQSTPVIAPAMIIAPMDHLWVVTVPIVPDSRIAATTAEPKEPPIR